MKTNLDVRTSLYAQRERELLQEAERMRLARLAHPQRRIGRHAVACLGRWLVVLGMWLERIERPEQREKHAFL
jgi:hypothetical protein